jgi:hypothetical protein
MWWTKPWTLKEGFLIGGGIITTGLALQLSAGPVVWDAFSWPANGIGMALFLAIILLMFLFRNQVYAFRYLSTNQAAIPAMSYAVLLTIVMGLTRQEVHGTWLNAMLSFWPFVLTYVYLAVVLGLVILRRLSLIVTHKSPNSMFHDLSFMLNHLGLFIALTTATLGNADMQRVKMMTTVGQPEWRALRPDGTVKEMSVAIVLRKFIMETYSDGSPKRFASNIHVMTKSGLAVDTIVDVNKPYEVNGWKIYQYGYDTQMGPHSQMSILELVRDPWLPLVYTGIYMMLAGAVCMFIFGGRKI